MRTQRDGRRQAAPHRRPGLLSAVAGREPSPAAPHCCRPPPKAYHRRPKQPARQGRYSRWPACARSVATAGNQLPIGDPGSFPPSPGESPHRPPPTAAGHRKRRITGAPNSPRVKAAIVGGPHAHTAWLPPASGPHRRPGLLSAVAGGEPSPAASHCRQPPAKVYHCAPQTARASRPL